MASRCALAAAIVVIVGCGSGARPTASFDPGQARPVGTITVFAASSLTDGFKRIGEQLTRQNPGTDVVFNFGSSSTLATQIVNGAPADLFASADDTSLKKLVDATLTDGAPELFAGNRLQIAVTAGNPKRIAGLADLAKPGLVVVLAAPSVPAGKYAADALRRAGVTVAPASHEIDVRAVLNKVVLGEADAGIVYVTDVRSAGPRVSGVDIPEQQQVVARYPIAVLRDARNPRLAKAFVAYLLSAEGQRSLAELGFSRP